MLLVIVCASGAQTYFSLMLPTCVHFRKMEHFCILDGKVRGRETRTATTTSHMNMITKATIYWNRHSVGGGELEHAFFCRAFSGRNRDD